MVNLWIIYGSMDIILNRGLLNDRRCQKWSQMSPLLPGNLHSPTLTTFSWHLFACLAYRRVFKKLTKAPSGCLWCLVLDCCRLFAITHAVSLGPSCFHPGIAEGKYEAEPGELEKEKAAPAAVQKIERSLQKISKNRLASFSQIGSAQTWCEE